MRRKNKETEESGRMIVGRGEKIFRVVNNCFMVLLMLITLYPLLYVLCLLYTSRAWLPIWD